MLQNRRWRLSSTLLRPILGTLGLGTLVLVFFYVRSWPFPPLLAYTRTEPLEIRGTWRNGTGLVDTQVVYDSSKRPVRDPFVRWEVLSRARDFVKGPNGPRAQVSVRGWFVYRPCPADVVAYLGCRNYRWEWSIATFFTLEGQKRDLWDAVAGDNRYEVEELVRAGADVNARGIDGVTPIWSARDPVVVKILVAAGANIDARSKFGNTALMIDAAGGLVDLVRTFLAAGANPNARDDDGHTPLLYALRQPLIRSNVPSLAVVRELIRAGARVNVSDRQGMTPLMCAVRGGWPDFGGGWAGIVRVLLAAHADVNARNQAAKTALTMAEEEGQAEIARLLKQAGAAD